MKIFITNKTGAPMKWELSRVKAVDNTKIEVPKKLIPIFKKDHKKKLKSKEYLEDIKNKKLIIEFLSSEDLEKIKIAEVKKREAEEKEKKKQEKLLTDGL